MYKVGISNQRLPCSQQLFDLMAKYHKLRVNHDFVRGAEARVSVTVGATADMKVSMKVHAKTVSDVYNKLSIEKSNLSTQTWEKIKDLHVGGTMKFFFGLFDLIAGDNHDYSNTETNTIIQQNSEAQAISKAFNDADTSDVSWYILEMGACARSM